MAELVSDLAAEHAELDDIVAGRPDADWRRPTPSPGWTVADQVGHLAYFDRAGARAIDDPEGFAVEIAALGEALERGEDPTSGFLDEFRALALADLLDTWRAARAGLLEAAAGLTGGDRLPWYGPSMSAASFLTARLMETWAHGQDVADALGVVRVPTDRLRHVAQLGVITRRWSYAVRGRETPPDPVAVVLRAPSGATWQWGDGAAESITGPAVDFCLVVTQRRSLEDTSLVVTGEHAEEWMRLAQAFAGAATEGPPPGGRLHRG